MPWGFNCFAARFVNMGIKLLGTTAFSKNSRNIFSYRIKLPLLRFKALGLSMAHGRWIIEVRNFEVRFVKGCILSGAC
jgi:hypothetical protein